MKTGLAIAFAVLAVSLFAPYAFAEHKYVEVNCGVAFTDNQVREWNIHKLEPGFDVLAANGCSYRQMASEGKRVQLVAAENVEGVQSVEDKINDGHKISMQVFATNQRCRSLYSRDVIARVYAGVLDEKTVRKPTSGPSVGDCISSAVKGFVSATVATKAGPKTAEQPKALPKAYESTPVRRIVTTGPAAKTAGKKRHLEGGPYTLEEATKAAQWLGMNSGSCRRTYLRGHFVNWLVQGVRPWETPRFGAVSLEKCQFAYEYDLPSK